MKNDICVWKYIEKIEDINKNEKYKEFTELRDCKKCNGNDIDCKSYISIRKIISKYKR
ncbi:MAG: hypothetical protein QXD48_02130 [Candidatus Aenigmatarchaeota archaeon]